LTGQQRSVIIDQLPGVMGLAAVNMSAITGLSLLKGQFPLFVVVLRGAPCREFCWEPGMGTGSYYLAR